MLVLLRSLDSSNNKSDQIFLMSPDSPNHDVIQLSREFAEQSVTIIGTMYKSKKSTNVVLLLALI